MDTSRAYIKMCDCSEIQGQWTPQSSRIKYAPANIDDVCMHRKTKRIGVLHTPKYNDLKDYVYLPRQDQIQEMIQKVKTPADHDVFLNDFYRFCFQGRYGDEWPWKLKEISCEQLWLAFYMHEKHGKTWDGKEWISK